MNMNMLHMPVAGRIARATTHIANLRACASSIRVSGQRLASTAAAGETPTDDIKRFDVVVVGGGIAGGTLACQLKANALFRNKRVAVIETSKPPATTGSVEDDSPDLRVYTISPASKRLLESAGVWSKMPAARIASFKEMQAWDAMGDGYIRFNSETANHPTLGYVIESKVLVRAVHDRMAELMAPEDEKNAPLELFCPAKLKHFHRPTTVASFSELGLEDGTRLQANLVVAADGGNSIVRTLTALGTWGWDYDQQAVVATIKTDVTNDVAWQRFFPTGPVAVLPMRDGYSSIVWSCSKEMAESLTSMSDEDFIARLNEALFAPPTSTDVPPTFPGIPGFSALAKEAHDALHSVLAAAAMTSPFVAPPKPVELVGRRMSFPLKLRHATSYVKQGVALVGDSAHSIHPLAGQGLNLGLADVQALSDLLVDGIKGGSELSDVHFLQQYEDSRKVANVNMAMVMDGFKRLFGPTPDAIAVARNVGMGSLNAVEPLKNKIMRYAMGL